MYSPPMPAAQPKKKGPMTSDRMKMLREQLDAESGMAGPPSGPIAGPVAGPGSQVPPAPLPQAAPAPAPSAAMTGNATDLGSQVQQGQGGTTNVAGPGQAGTPMPGYTPPAQDPKDALKDAKAEQEAEAYANSIEGQSEAFIKDLLGKASNVDTSAEEAEIRAMMDEILGGQLMDSAAAAGASGFAQSGAQYALEGDLRRRGARDTSQQILDLRRSEQQRAIDNAFAGMGADIDRLDAKAQAEVYDLMMQLLTEDGPEEPRVGPDSGLDEDEAAEADAANNGEAPPDAEKYKDWSGDGAPVGMLTGQDENFAYIFGLDGKLWKVPLADYMAGGG